MTTDKSIFIVIKLSTGETVLATMVDQDEHSITIEYPIEMKWFPETINGSVVYKLTAMVYCPFTQDRTFVLRVRDVQHVSHMSAEMIDSYLNLVTNGPPKESVEQEPIKNDPSKVIH